MAEVENDELGMGHWYLFLNQNRKKSFEDATKLAKDPDRPKQKWHEHRKGEPCVEGMFGCRVLEQEGGEAIELLEKEKEVGVETQTALSTSPSSPKKTSSIWRRIANARRDH
jgi:hypothetical protein